MTLTDPGHESRCVRAGAMNALAQLRGDPIMQEMAVELALVECGRYPNLAPSQVFRSVAPIIDSHTGRDGTIDPARLAATLEAELASIATTDVEVGGSP